MRKIVPGLAVLLAATAGGYYYYWHTQAEGARASVETALTRLNSAAKWFTYESLSTSGFPSTVTVTIHKPVITVPTGQLLGLAAMMQAGQTGAPASTVPADWVDTFSFGDAIHVHLPLKSDTVVLESTGIGRAENTISGQKTVMAQQSPGSSTCTIALASGGRAAINAQIATGTPEQLGNLTAQYFQSMECVNAAATWIDEASKEPLLQYETSSFRLALNRAVAGRLGIALGLQSPGTEFTKASDAVFERYFKVLDATGDVGFAIPLSALGKASANLDFTADVPLPLNTLSKQTPITVTLKQFDYKSALYDFSINLSVEHKPDASGAFQSATAMDYKSNVTPQYMTAIEGAISKEITRALKSKVEPSQLQAFTARFPEGELAERVSSLLPRFDQLGTLVGGWDARFEANADMSTSALSLKRLEVGCTPYGLLAEGEGKRTAPAPVPVGKLTLTCRQCEPLIRDTVSWAERVAAFLREADPEKAAAFAVPTGLAENLVQFVRTQGTQASEAGNFLFVFESAETGTMTVNGKPLMEFLAAFQQLMPQPQQPVLEAPQPQ